MAPTLGHWRPPQPCRHTACPTASPILPFLFALRFILAAIKFFLPVQEQQVQKQSLHHNLFWIQSYPISCWAFVLWLKKHILSIFFSGFLVYCTTPPAFGSNQVTYPSFEVQSPKLDPVVQGTIFCVKHKMCIMCLVSVQSCSCTVGRGIVTTLYLSTTVYFHRKPYPYFPSLWLVQLVYSLCVIP